MGNEWEGVFLRNEDWIRSAVEAGGDVGSKIVDGTCKVRAAHEYVGEEEAHENGADPCSNKAWIKQSVYGRFSVDDDARLLPSSSATA